MALYVDSSLRRPRTAEESQAAWSKKPWIVALFAVVVLSLVLAMALISDLAGHWPF